MIKHSCEVCGLSMHKKFLQPWNSKDVCRPCIVSIEAETASYYVKAEEELII